MSKNIYICFREAVPASAEKQIYDICKRLEPENITPAKPKIFINDNIAYGVMNPTKILLEEGNSLLMGLLFNNDEKWHVPLEDFPDGSYALFRDGKDYCEIVSDPVASRTIWYYKDEKIFVASTSQRAIIMLVGSFEFDERIIPWMLSTGTLGPDFSWDKRIKRLPSDSSVVLDKNKWTFTSRVNPVLFKTVPRTNEAHGKLLFESIKTTFQEIKLDLPNWALPLSGGYDSRGILCFLHYTTPGIGKLRTITWGLKTSQSIKNNDAYIAKKLAENFNMPHKYYHTDLSDEPLQKTINRFLYLGEGRTDNLKGYMDGFRLWKTIFEEGIEGIIRGDEGFGCRHYTSAKIARINQACALCTDFSNLKNYKDFGFPSQELPQQLMKTKAETLDAWKDRIFHEHDLPTEFSALSDLKLSYVEVINPLLSKRILEQVRQLPDHLRTDKRLFKKIVVSFCPDIKFAVSTATDSSINILKQQQFVKMLKEQLSDDEARKIFPDNFLKLVIKEMKSEDLDRKPNGNSVSLFTLLKNLIPQVIRESLRNRAILPTMDDNLVAFRVMLISKMNSILNEDSLHLKIV